MVDLTTVSIIVLLYNGWNLGHARLGELYRFIPKGTEVILVNNGSDDEDVQKGLDWWKRVRPEPHPGWLKVVDLPENLGFSKGFNVGIKQATGRYVVCLSSDVHINRPFCQDLVTMVGEDDKIVLGGRLIDWKAGWNQVGDLVIPYLEGWIIAASRKAWDELGGWDERYSPYDYEDVDLSANALSKGFHLSTFPSGIFQHQGGGTFTANLISSEERKNQTLINQKKFLDKWMDRIPEILKGLSNESNHE